MASGTVVESDLAGPALSLTEGEEERLLDSDREDNNPQSVSFLLFNTQNMTNPTIVSPVKMEYGWDFRISGLKLMVKSGLEKIFLKFLHAHYGMEQFIFTNTF